jgi:hypothetical protein
MKKVMINNWQVGLVFKNGSYYKFLQEGSYWFWTDVQVLKYSVTESFIPPVDLNILLTDADFAEAVELVEVKDNEIVLVYKEGVLNKVLTAGQYAFWKGPVKYTFLRDETSKIEIAGYIDRTALQNPPVLPHIRSAEVQNYEKALLFVDGNFAKLLQPGVYFWWKNSILVHVAKADVRLQQMEINGQEILTKDKAALRINAWAQYRIVDIEKALLENKEFEKQLYVSFQLVLREYIAGFGFDEMLERKETMSSFVAEHVKNKAEVLGVEVAGFGIRDIVLPGDVKDIMSQVLVAEKKAQANIIMRREETASTRSLLNTAKLMEENAMLWKLKEMEYVEKIADKISNITVSGNGVLVEQLKQIFLPQK